LPKSSKSIYGILAICLATTLWGLDGVVLTPKLQNLEVAFVVFILHALPFLLMHPFLWKSYRYLSKLSPADVLTILLVGLFGGSLGTLAIVKALFLVHFQDLTVVVLLQKLQPVFAISLAFLLLKERPNRYFMLWAILAIVAGYFLTFGWGLPNFDTGENTTYAAIYALVAAFSFGVSTVLGKRLLLKYPSTTTTFFRYGATSILMLIYVLSTDQLNGFAQMTPQNWQFVFLIISFSGSTMLFIYYYGLKRVQAKVATIAELCFPISTIVFGYIFNDTILSWTQWIAAAVMVYAIIQISNSEKG